MNAVTIRRMTAEDIPFVAALEHSCFSEPWSENSFRESLQNPNALLFTALYGDERAGYAVAENICGEVNLYTIAVASSFRGNTVGKNLLLALIEEATRLHALFITLEVRTSNSAALALYDHCGFRQVGIRKQFYRLPTEDALLFTLQISEE